MKIHLGYVALSLTLEDTSYSRTMTYTSYKKKDAEESNKILSEKIKNNINGLLEILKYNYDNDIRFFRLSHKVIPLATLDEVSFDYMSPFINISKKIGAFSKKYNIRLDTHPDQFCVLNSINEDVVKASFKILDFNNNLFKLFSIDGKMVIHVGSSVPNKDEAIKRFKENFKNLDDEIKEKIILENDDKTYTVLEVLEICEELKIPMVLDYLHYKCNNNSEDLVSLLPRIFATWDNSGFVPKIHFSTSKSRKEKRSHSFYINYKDFINFLKKIAVVDRDVDVMLECKGKDEALFRLVRQLKFYTNIKFIDNVNFILDKESFT